MFDKRIDFSLCSISILDWFKGSCCKMIYNYWDLYEISVHSLLSMTQLSVVTSIKIMRFWCIPRACCAKENLKFYLVKLSLWINASFTSFLVVLLRSSFTQIPTWCLFLSPDISLGTVVGDINDFYLISYTSTGLRLKLYEYEGLTSSTKKWNGHNIHLNFMS